MTLAGSSISSSLTASTTPETGERTSETALTDSTSEKASPAVTESPLLGQVDKDDIAQGMLRKIGEADDIDVVLLRTHS